MICTLHDVFINVVVQSQSQHLIKLVYNSCDVDYLAALLETPTPFLQYFAHETTPPLEAEVETLQTDATDSFLRIEAKLKRLKRLKKEGRIAGFLKPIVHEVAALRKKLVSGFTNIKDAMRSFFTSKRSFGCGEDGDTVIREHFHELVDAVSQLGMHDITLEAYSKGLITDEVKNTVLSMNGTSEGVKANILVSAIKQRIKGDPSAFNMFVEILRSDPAYKHLADKLTSSF